MTEPLPEVNSYPGCEYKGRQYLFEIKETPFKHTPEIGEKYKKELKHREKRQDHAEMLRLKYPNGVWFDTDGYPDFSPYAIAKVVLNGLTGYNTIDMTKANNAIGLSKHCTPRGYVWHHHQDTHTMLLIPIEVHDGADHQGGAEILRRQGLQRTTIAESYEMLEEVRQYAQYHRQPGVDHDMEKLKAFATAPYYNPDYNPQRDTVEKGNKGR